MNKIFSLIAVVLILGPLLPAATTAQVSREKNLPLDASIAANGRAVELRWGEADPPRVGGIIINRRLLGQTGASSWQALGPALRPVMRFQDDSTRPGVAYEYQVLRSARDIVDVGYWATGVELPAIAQRGTAYMLVDETLSEDLAAHLDRFQRDLTGDGWRVVRRDVPRGAPEITLENFRKAATIRAWLAQQYQADVFGQHTVILIGHVPLVLSGRAAPDGHEPTPHATDLFYADVDGRWRVTPDGQVLDNQVPDSTIEMQIGRIDFSPVSNGKRLRELRLLRAYLDKTHHWRMGLIGDLRRAYGQNDHLIAEQFGLRNIVGAENVTKGGHHDVGEEGPWLWGVDFGSHKGGDYAREFSNQAVFAINFGSNKQEIQKRFNAMTALLAQKWYPIAVGWGGRPAWRLHHMALGGTIGEVHRRTVNNGMAEQPYRKTMDYYPTGKYLWRNPVWVNLLGDPTTRGFVLAPPSAVRVTASDPGRRITWQASPDPDTTGYRLFRAPAGSTAFTPLAEGAVVTDLSYLDRDGSDGARYMVRAYGLKDVYAGSFYTLSQGAFSSTGPAPETRFALTTPMNTPLPLPQVFRTPQDGQIYALIEGPQTGQLKGWDYIPPAGFTGTVELRFSASDVWTTRIGTLTITVTDP